MNDATKLINERAELWEEKLLAEFQHREHPDAFSKERMNIAVRNWLEFHIKHGLNDRKG